MDALYEVVAAGLRSHADEPLPAASLLLSCGPPSPNAERWTTVAAEQMLPPRADDLIDANPVFDNEATSLRTALSVDDLLAEAGAAGCDMIDALDAEHEHHAQPDIPDSPNTAHSRLARRWINRFGGFDGSLIDLKHLCLTQNTAEPSPTSVMGCWQDFPAQVNDCWDLQPQAHGMQPL